MDIRGATQNLGVVLIALSDVADFELPTLNPGHDERIWVPFFQLPQAYQFLNSESCRPGLVFIKAFSVTFYSI